MSIMRLRKIFNKSVGIRIGKFRLRLGSIMVIILMGLALLFIFALIPGGPGGTTDRAGREGQRRVTGIVATIDKHKIGRQDFAQRLGLFIKRQPMPVGLIELGPLKQQLLDGLIEHHLLLKAARAEGISVSRREIDQRIEELVSQQTNRRFPEQKQLREFLESQELSYEEYQQELRSHFASDREALRGELLVGKLEKLVIDRIQATDEQVKADYTEVKMRRILLIPDKIAAKATAEQTAEAALRTPEALALQKAEELLEQIKEGGDFAQLAKENSAGPSAQKGGDLGWFGHGRMVPEFEEAAFALQPGETSDIVQTVHGFHIIKVEERRDDNEVRARHILIKPDEFKEQAAQKKAAEAPQQSPVVLTRQKAEGLLKQIREGADFAQLAKENSHDPRSAAQGGDLGWLRRGQMPSEWADAVFTLQPGQVSQIVETDRGLDILKAEERRTNLPEDFEENNQRYKQQFLFRRQSQAWQEYKHNLRQHANIEIADPELRGLALLAAGNETEAIGPLTEAADNDPDNLTARYQLAGIYQRLDHGYDAVKYLRQITEHAQGAATPQVHLELGQLLRKRQQDEEALKEFTAASDWATAYQFQNYFIHTQLRGIFKEMGDDEGVKQEKQWLAEFNKLQESALGSSLP